MTLAARIVYFGALIIGLLAGAIGAFEYYTPMMSMYWEGQPFMAQHMFDNFSVLQYRHADHDHAQVALQTTAAFVEELDKANPDSTQKMDIAFSYTRLSLLDDAAGNSVQSQADMAEAQSWWKASLSHPATDSQLKAAVQRIDKRPSP